WDDETADLGLRLNDELYLQVIPDSSGNERGSCTLKTDITLRKVGAWSRPNLPKSALAPYPLRYVEERGPARCITTAPQVGRRQALASAAPPANLGALSGPAPGRAVVRRPRGVAGAAAQARAA